MVKSHKNITYYNAKDIDGALLMCESVEGIGFGEIVEVIPSNGEKMKGQIVDVSDDVTVIQIFEKSSGISLESTGIHFTGEVVKIPVSLDILGRSFSGIGKVIDGGPEIIPDEYREVQALTLNPTTRTPPTKFIQTGISVIDGLMTLMLGQKLPLLSGSGMLLQHLSLGVFLAGLQKRLSIHLRRSIFRVRWLRSGECAWRVVSSRLLEELLLLSCRCLSPVR